MKTFSCILLIVATMEYTICYPEEVPEEIKKVYDKCAKEIGLTKDDMKGNLMENIDDPKMRCFMACAGKKFGHLEEGRIQIDKVLKFYKNKGLNDENAESKLLECGYLANKQFHECDVADAMAKCMKSLQDLPL